METDVDGPAGAWAERLQGMGKPVLAFDRAKANRRRTRVLLALFVVSLQPVSVGIATWLMPILMDDATFVRSWEIMMDGRGTFQEELFLRALTVSAFGLALVTALLVYVCGSTIVLWLNQARVVDRGEELQLHRVVENLCIGAALPKPHLHVIDSETPNAFATGRDATCASIAVTRGLLTLLNRRELEAVVAHELSHIASQDTRLSTTLAAVIGTLSLPLTAIRVVLDAPVLASLILGPLLVLMIGNALNIPLALGLLGREAVEFPSVLWWLHVSAVTAPFYIVLVAPVIGRMLARAVSCQREFAADAEAVLLTRNPTALARALVKVGSTTEPPMRVGTAAVHLYFVDPLRHDARSWTVVARSHPSIEERLDRLAGMGSGITPTALQEARSVRAAMRDWVEIDDETGVADGVILAAQAQAGGRYRLMEPVAPLYERADGWSPVIAQLTARQLVTIRGKDLGFIRVVSEDGRSGYVGPRTQLRADDDR